MSKLYNPRLAKSYYCYTVPETAELYSCHKNTVRNWLNNGLEPIDTRRPIMVSGAVLNAFHAERRANAKRPCTPGEIYCFSCGQQRKPAPGLFEYTPINGAVGTVTAICPVCCGVMSQRVGSVRLAAFEEPLQAECPLAQRRIRDRAEPFGNCDFEQNEDKCSK